MLKRRSFLKAAGAAAAAALVSRHTLVAEIAGVQDAMTCALLRTVWNWNCQHAAPEFLSLNVDGLGKGRRGNSIVDAKGMGGDYKVSSSMSGGVRRVAYRNALAGENSPPAWTFEFSGSKIVLRSEWSADCEPAAMVFHFNLNQVHSTVLGVYRKSNLLAVPALMHFPGQGSMRLTANFADMGLTYTSDRPKSAAMLSLPGATFEHKHVVYTLEVTAIYPDIPGIAGDSRFDAFRRNWLNALATQSVTTSAGQQYSQRQLRVLLL